MTEDDAANNPLSVPDARGITEINRSSVILVMLCKCLSNRRINYNALICCLIKVQHERREVISHIDFDELLEYICRIGYFWTLKKNNCVDLAFMAKLESGFLRLIVRLF